MIELIFIGGIIFICLKFNEWKAQDHMEKNKIDYNKMNDDVLLNRLSRRKTQDNIAKGKYDVKK